MVAVASVVSVVAVRVSVVYAVFAVSVVAIVINAWEMSSDAAKKTMESNRICFIKAIECLQYLAASKDRLCRVLPMMNQTLFSYLN